MPEAQIQVAKSRSVLVIRVIGRATFKVGRELREYALAELKAMPAEIIVDLEQCEGMDSTFMGVLAMIGLNGRGKANLVLVNANEQHRRLLDGIGVSKVWTYAEEPVPDADWKTLCMAAEGAADMAACGRTVLEAHKTLMELDAENIPKFKNVVDLLSAELKSDS